MAFLSRLFDGSAKSLKGEADVVQLAGRDFRRGQSDLFERYSNYSGAVVLTSISVLAAMNAASQNFSEQSVTVAMACLPFNLMAATLWTISSRNLPQAARAYSRAEAVFDAAVEQYGISPSHQLETRDPS